MQELHPLTFVQCLHFIKHFVINHSYICLTETINYLVTLETGPRPVSTSQWRLLGSLAKQERSRRKGVYGWFLGAQLSRGQRRSYPDAEEQSPHPAASFSALVPRKLSEEGGEAPRVGAESRGSRRWSAGAGGSGHGGAGARPQGRPPPGAPGRHWRLSTSTLPSRSSSATTAAPPLPALTWRPDGLRLTAQAAPAPALASRAPRGRRRTRGGGAGGRAPRAGPGSHLPAREGQCVCACVRARAATWLPGNLAVGWS